MDRTLIEEESFDLVRLFHLIGEEAKREKNAIPPINEILYWWTRKPLIVSRAVALVSTLKDINKARHLLGINSKERAFKSTPSIPAYNLALGGKSSEINILDPFGGAGNLIFEAKRLELNCSVFDYNPVAYLIMKSILEYPPKYGTILVDDIKKYGKEVIERSKKEIEQFFVRKGKKPLTYLWVWCIRCPYCKQRIPLTNHMWILKKEKKRIGIRFKLTDDLNFEVELVDNMHEGEGEEFTQRGGKAICIRCRNSIDYEHLSNDIANRKDREMIVIVVRGSNGKEYEIATEEDRKVYSDAITYLNGLWNSYQEQDLIPHEDIKASHRRENLLWHYGIRKWYQFYSERQLLVILTLLKNIRDLCNEISDRQYSKIVATYLMFSLCRHVDYNSIGISWHVGREVIGHTLAFRSPRIFYNHAEVNPFEKTSGGLVGILNDISNSVKFASLNVHTCNVSMASILHPPSVFENIFDLIITDPPYMDDVQYAEISDFFYVWLYRGLKDHYPELPPSVPIEEDVSVSWGRFGNLKLANDYYEKAMREAFKQIYKLLKYDGLLVLFFAHSSTEAWNLLLNVLRYAKLRVVSSYAVHTESVVNVMATGKTSFMSSIVVACRKIHEDKIAYFEDILPEIEDRVKDLLKNLTLDELLELPMTDLLIMTYGKVLEETTQHTILKSYRADFNPEFENLIKVAREFILKEIVTKLTGKSPNILGANMSFYIVTKSFYRGILDSNEAIKVAWAYSIDLEDLKRKQVAKKESGITSLLFYDEVNFEKKSDEIDRNSLHEQLLYLESITDREGVIGVKRAVSQNNNFRVQDLKQIVNLLIKGHRMRLNKGEVLKIKEQKELKILESLADMFHSSIPYVGGEKTLEEFMG